MVFNLCFVYLYCNVGGKIKLYAVYSLLPLGIYSLTVVYGMRIQVGDITLKMGGKAFF